MKSALRIAVLCGALPLVLGTGVFVLWLFTRWDWLMGAGYLVIYAGIGCVAIGSIALLRYAWLASKLPSASKRHSLRLAAATGLLLLSNFPVAAGITMAVYDVVSNSFRVVVHNASDETLLSARVVGAGCDEEFGPMAPGGEVSRGLRIRGEGSLTFRAETGTAVHEATVAGYVSTNWVWDLTVVVEEDGAISVHP